MAKYLTSPPNLTGMPPGVPYIIGNEAAERFNYYGMKSILTVFMAHYILNNPACSRRCRLTRPTNTPTISSPAFITFPSSARSLPTAGSGNIEPSSGSRSSIVWAVLPSRCMDTSWGIGIGQRTMLAIGLGLICIGSGGIKPCVSANVGDQFGESNKHLLSKMFGWFYFSINAGSFISSIICPWMLANGALGPRWAFGIPGISMVIATIFFWAGRNKMVHVPPRGLGYLREAFLTREGLTILARIAMVYFFILFFWALWGMSNGVEWTLQAEKMDLHWLGMNLIAAQVQTANPILILICIPLTNYLIYPAIDRVFPLTPLRKIGIGLFLTAISFVVIVWIQSQIDHGLKPSINWQLLGYVILTLGETMVSITGLEFSYTQAPNSMKSSVMALWLLFIASGEFFVGLFNAWDVNADGTKKMTDFQYFGFFTIVMFVASAVFVVLACFYKGRTYLQSQLTPDEVATEPIVAGGTPT